MSRHFRASVAVVASLGLVLAACSGGGTASPSASSTPATTPPASTAASPSAEPTTSADSATTDSSAASSSESGATSAAPTGPVVELSMLTGFTGPDKPAYEALVAEFNQTHPNIKVTMDVQPWDAIGQKLPSSWATGQGPDLATPNFDPGIDLPLHQDELGRCRWTMRSAQVTGRSTRRRSRSR